MSDGKFRLRVALAATGETLDHVCASGADTVASLCRKAATLVGVPTSCVQVAAKGCTQADELTVAAACIEGSCTILVSSPESLVSLLVADDSGKAAVWEIQDGTKLLELKGHTECIGSVTSSSDGTQLLTASFDGTARLWKSCDGACLGVLESHRDGVAIATLSPNGQLAITVAASDFAAKVWRTRDCLHLWTLRGHEARISSACFSLDNTMVLTTSWDGTARLWTTNTAECTKMLWSHGRGLTSGALSHCRTRVLTGASDCTAKVWDWEKDTHVTLAGHRGSVMAVAFSHTGYATRTVEGKAPLRPLLAVTASRDGEARVWRVEDGFCLYTLEHDGHPLNSIVFSADTTRLATISAETATVFIWKTFDKSLLHTFGNLKHSPSTASALSVDGSLVATASSNGVVQVWSALDGTLVRVLEVGTGACSLCFSP